MAAAIQELHIHPERADWTVVVGHTGGEFTILTAIQPEPAFKAFFVNAVPQSAL